MFKIKFGSYVEGKKYVFNQPMYRKNIKNKE